MLEMSQVDLRRRRVMIRADLNVPIHEGRITNDARIRAVIPTLKSALEQEAAVILISHLGRPKAGVYDASLSLKPVAERLSQLLERSVPLQQDWLDGITVSPGQMILCENVRFNAGESSNDPQLAQRMAQLCDVFVMDAFATAHRAEASTEGIMRYAAEVCAGPLLAAEVQALTSALDHPSRPLMAIVGGAKVSTKLSVIEQLGQKADQLIVGGGIANTFLKAAGYPVGKSLYEPDMLSAAERILKLDYEQQLSLPLPADVIVAERLDEHAILETRRVHEVQPNDIIVDIGEQTIQQYLDLIKNSRTILWNGPLGIFENPLFARGTQTIAEAIAHSMAFSVAGGGETVSAIEQWNLSSQFSYLSTAGGAFLEFIGGTTLPALALLEARQYKH